MLSPSVGCLRLLGLGTANLQWKGQMYFLTTAAQAATQLDAETASNYGPVDAVVLRFFLFPFTIVVISYILKSLSEIRKEHLSNVRVIEAMIAEVDSSYNSWQTNRKAFEQAYVGGSKSTFAQRISENPNYYPYIVAIKSTGSVFSSDTSPPVTFAFIRSEVMDKLVKFHDSSSLLNDLLADLREKAFQELPADRKLAALGKVVDQFRTADEKYNPCIEALNYQQELLTSRSLTWAILFPWKAKTLFMHIFVIWMAFYGIAMQLKHTIK